MVIRFTFIGLLLFITHVQCIMWYMEPNTVKCIREEVEGNALVSGEYEVSEVPGQKIHFITRDSKGHILAQKDDVPHKKPMKFSFALETFDMFEMCFTSQVPHNIRGMRHEISLDVKRGIETKSYEAIAEVSKLKPIEVELKRLEDLSETIVQDFDRMRKREEEMRDTNELTNSRVLYFSIFSMFCLLSLATWQVIYLKRYFKAKKLIE